MLQVDEQHTRFNIVEMRHMRDMQPQDELFGKSFLWAVRMHRR
jgi:hypothetical protein